MKKSIEEWAQDCKAIGIQARRYGYANKCLSTDELREAEDALDRSIKVFANKYGICRESAESIAYIVADGVSLGLSY